MLRSPKPDPEKPLRTYYSVALAVVIFVGALLKGPMQAWYKTMPADEAKTIGLCLIVGLVVAFTAGAIFVSSRS